MSALIVLLQIVTHHCQFCFKEAVLTPPQFLDLMGVVSPFVDFGGGSLPPTRLPGCPFNHYLKFG